MTARLQAEPTTNAHSTTNQPTMKAIVREKYGAPDVLELKNVPKPVVDDDSVLVRVRAASINAYLTRVLALSRYEFVRELSPGVSGLSAPRTHLRPRQVSLSNLRGRDS